MPVVVVVVVIKMVVGGDMVIKMVVGGMFSGLVVYTYFSA